MEFRDAARILGEQITTAEMAEALGVSHSTARQARMKPDAPGYRRPPPNWRSVLARLARERARRLEELAAELDRGTGDE